jgi:hypothetical protein
MPGRPERDRYHDHVELKNAKIVVPSLDDGKEHWAKRRQRPDKQKLLIGKYYNAGPLVK